MEAARRDVPHTYQIHTEFLRSGGRDAVEELFSLDIPPTGIVVSDDFMSLGVLSMLKESGYRVPEDISLVSFNNVYLSEITSTSLTTVDIQIYNLVYKSAKELIIRANKLTEQIIINIIHT